MAVGWRNVRRRFVASSRGSCAVSYIAESVLPPQPATRGRQLSLAPWRGDWWGFGGRVSGADTHSVQLQSGGRVWGPGGVRVGGCCPECIEGLQVSR